MVLEKGVGERWVGDAGIIKRKDPKFGRKSQGLFGSVLGLA